MSKKSDDNVVPLWPGSARPHDEMSQDDGIAESVRLSVALHQLELKVGTEETWNRVTNIADQLRLRMLIQKTTEDDIDVE